MRALVGRVRLGVEVGRRDFIVVDDERLRVASRRIGRMAIHAILDRAGACPWRAIGTGGHISLKILHRDGVPQPAFSGQFHVESEIAGVVALPEYVEAKIHPSVHIRHNIVDDHLLIDIPAPAEHEIRTYEREMKIVSAAVMFELPDDVLCRRIACSLHGRHEIFEQHAEAVFAVVAVLVDGPGEAGESEFAARVTAADIRRVIQNYLVRDGEGSVVGATSHYINSVLGRGEAWFDARN